MEQNKQEEVYYTRYQHGGALVRVHQGKPRRYELSGEGFTKMFRSARKLLMYIHGGKDVHITFDRYFKTGKHASLNGSRVSVLDLLNDSKGVKSLGIDLEKRGHEVAKLFYSGFGSGVIKSGYDPEDVLQDIYRGLIARNKGSCPYDPEKSSFGHYVHMVCRCIINNLHRKENKRRTKEVLGLPTFVGDSWERADLSTNETLGAESDIYFQDMNLKKTIRHLEEFIDEGELPKDLKKEVKNMIPLLLAGHTQKEIMKKLSLSKAGLRKTLGILRSEAKEWMSWT